MTPEETRATILDLLANRRSGASICPSEVARRLDPDQWRERMDTIRVVARQLAREGCIDITQRGSRLDPDEVFRGPIRLRLPIETD